MDTIFMKSENSKTSKSHVSVLKLTDKLDLGNGKKVTIYYTWKNIKGSYNNNQFKISDLIPYQIYKIISNTF